MSFDPRNGITTITATPEGGPAPRVTALVSTYKSERFMQGCLDDLVGQTLFERGELEILVIDSGSPENEGAIVRAMQARYPAIRYVRTERETLYAAWNRGIALARGTYLTSANTDDRHRPDALEQMARALDAQSTVAVVYADSMITRYPNETWNENRAHGRLGWPDFSYDELLRRCIVGPQPMWRRSLHERWGGFDERYAVAGDYEFWLRIGRTERFERLPGTLGLYLQNTEGLEYASGRTAAESREIQARYAATALPAPAAVTVVASGPVVAATPPAAPGHGAVTASFAAAFAASTGQASVAPLASVSPIAAAPAPRPSAGREPAVSVIMPTFNRPDFLVRALTSLANQTWKDFEVVVINDAGQALEPLLERFAGKLAITYVRHAINRDRAAARNSGIRVARGKAIAYLDDDDVYRPDHLEVLTGALARGTHAVVYSQAAWITEEKTADGYRALGAKFEPDPSFNLDRLMVLNWIPILSLMHQRSCLDDVGMFDEELGTHEDWDLLIRLANRFPVLHVPTVTAEVSLRSDGSTTTSSKFPDFTRTMRLIHARYRHLIANRPDLMALQRRVTGDEAPVPTPAAPSEAERTVVAARAALDRGDASGAAGIVSGQLHIANKAPELLLVLADAFVAMNDANAARETLEQAVRLHPGHAGVLARRAQLNGAAALR